MQPDLAFFGQKDAQQCAVIKQIVQDLNMNLGDGIRSSRSLTIYHVDYVLITFVVVVVVVVVVFVVVNLLETASE